MNTTLIFTSTFQHGYLKILEIILSAFHLYNILFRKQNNSEVLHWCAEVFYSTVQLVQTHNFLEMFLCNSDAMLHTKSLALSQIPVRKPSPYNVNYLCAVSYMFV